MRFAILLIAALAVPSTSHAGFFGGGTGICTRTTAPAWMAPSLWRVVLTHRATFCSAQTNPRAYDAVRP